MIHCTSVEKDEYLFLPKIFEKKGPFLLIFQLCKKFLAPGQNWRDERDYSAFGRGCMMRDCRIERNGTVVSFFFEIKSK